HETPDRPEADESHFAVLRAHVFNANFFGVNFLCANDGAVAGGIEFRGTCHSISRASDYLSDYVSDSWLGGPQRRSSLAGGQPVFPASFHYRRSGIADA